MNAFLKEGSYFVQRSLGLINLDYYMILPMSPVDSSGESAIYDYDQRINQSFINTNNVNKTFELIMAESNRLNLYTSLKPINLNQQGKALYNVISDMVQKILPITISIFLFTSISIITSLLSILRKNTKEFGIHLLSGATIKDISLRILTIVIFYIGISTVIAILTSSALKSVLFPDLSQTQSFYYTVPLILLIIVVISIIPLVKLSKTEMHEIIRRKE